jgi:ssDNA-binding Zn-finger/Zn-ribbon topoisomerase 1
MGSVRCPKCGRKTTIRTAREDDSLYHVCINYPKCRGRVLADEDQGGDWDDDLGQERPASETAYDRPLQRVKPSSPERGAKKTVRTAKKSGRKVRAGAKTPERKRRGPVGKTWSEDWGEGISAPKPAIAPGKDDWDEKIPAPKSAPDRARRHVAPKPAIASDKKKSLRPQQRIAPKAETAPDVKVPPKLRQQRVPQRYLAPEKKKRSTVVIIIALIVAFLAVDGMIYAAFVLR